MHGFALVYIYIYINNSNYIHNLTDYSDLGTSFATLACTFARTGAVEVHFCSAFLQARSAFRPHRCSPSPLLLAVEICFEVRFDRAGAVQMRFADRLKICSKYVSTAQAQSKSTSSRIPNFGPNFYGAWVEVRFDRTGAAQIIFFAFSRFSLKYVSTAQAQSKLTFSNFWLFGSKHVSTAQALPKPTFKRSRLWRFEASNLRGPLD